MASARLLLASTLAALILGTSASGASDSTPAHTPSTQPPGKALTTEEERTLYAVGLVLGQRTRGFALTPAELEIVKAGLTAGALGQPPAVDLKVYGPKINALLSTRTRVTAQAEEARGKAYIEEQAKKQGVVRTPGGGLIETVSAGTGPAPTIQDSVKVHYVGTLLDGTVFDSSRARGTPETFSLGHVIGCWGEALPRMKVGGRARLVCPAQLAYGEQAQGTIPPGATLLFDVELLEIAPRAAAHPSTPAGPGGGTGAPSGGAGATAPNAGGTAGSAPR